MDSIQENHSSSQADDLFIVDSKQAEALRQIIADELQQDLDLRTAKEIGGNLLRLFKGLAGNRQVTPGRLVRSKND